jgi:uncharacterized protein (TIGR00251 family)
MMAHRNVKLHNGRSGTALAIRVVPRARRDEISELMADGTIKIRLKAPPVDGKANKALIRFLSRVLNVPQRDIEIVAGETKRNKIVTILDLDQGTVQDRIVREAP